MNLDCITPLIITLNEESNLDRVLKKLDWAKRIVIVDSLSTDRTLEIAARYSQVRIFQKPYTHFADQCNYGLAQTETEWILSLDADYVLTDDWLEEVRALQPTPAVGAYETSFRYCIFGEPLRTSLYPPRPVLFRRNGASYLVSGHAHALDVQGARERLRSPILHDDRKSFGRWMDSQKIYAEREAEKILTTPEKQLEWNDRIRKRVFFAPFLVLFYCLFAKGLVMGGRRGIYYGFQRMLAELMLSLQLIEKNRKH